MTTSSLRLDDLGPDLNRVPPSADGPAAVEVTLAQIVTRTVNLPTTARADSPLRVSVLNLKGLAAIEREFGSLDTLNAKLSGAGGVESTLKLITVLVNQDLPDGAELSEESVGRMLSAERLPLVRRIVEEMTRPLLVAAPAANPGATASPASGPTGAG